MNIKRVMIAAPKSGSGKTTITCAILKALADKGENIISFKCGPDYIDPMFHRQAIGISSGNLDTFFTDPETTLNIFAKESSGFDIAVIEGVMGLFDGLGGIRREGSSYDLAAVTKTPIILTVDAKGMGKSVIPLIAGFLKYDTEHLIRGVILNRMSESCYSVIKPLIEEELGITVLGYFPENKEIILSSRHLGLVLPNEISSIQDTLSKAAKELEKCVSLEGIISIGKTAGELYVPQETQNALAFVSDVRIAVAMDEAFCFYYMENLNMLKEMGAELLFFSPIHDHHLPSEISGIVLGGGYPELYLAELSENKEMLSEIRRAFEKKIPVIAECGGFMYLHSSITDSKGQSFPVAGVLRGECRYTGKSVRFGYIEVKDGSGAFLTSGKEIRGHEFHYYDSSFSGDSCIAKKPVTKREYPCIIADENCWLGFPHLYYPSEPSFAVSFIRKACEFSTKIRS